MPQGIGKVAKPSKEKDKKLSKSSVSLSLKDGKEDLFDRVILKSEKEEIKPKNTSHDQELSVKEKISKFEPESSKSEVNQNSEDDNMELETGQEDVFTDNDQEIEGTDSEESNHENELSLTDLLLKMNSTLNAMKKEQ